MKVIDFVLILIKDLYQYLLGVVVLCFIVFVSIVDEYGNYNLVLYSFFNCFSFNLFIVVFFFNWWVLDNSIKDILYNIMQIWEVVINVVNYNIVW